MQDYCLVDARKLCKLTLAIRRHTLAVIVASWPTTITLLIVGGKRAATIHPTLITAIRPTVIFTLPWAIVPCVIVSAAPITTPISAPIAIPSAAATILIAAIPVIWTKQEREKANLNHEFGANYSHRREKHCSLTVSATTIVSIPAIHSSLIVSTIHILLAYCFLYIQTFAFDLMALLHCGVRVLVRSS